MLRESATADCHWAVALHVRILNDASDDRLVGDPAWDALHITLLAKRSAPTAFKLLRPIAVLLASAKLWSRCMLHALEAYDIERSPSHMGFQKAHSCAELVATIRPILDHRQEWGLSTRVAQIDLARAYDSDIHVGSSRLPRAASSRTAAMWQGRGPQRTHLDARPLADDKRLLDASRAGLEAMLRGVATRADMETGPALRSETCSGPRRGSGRVRRRLGAPRAPRGSGAS